jgi:hypothetical protein
LTRRSLALLVLAVFLAVLNLWDGRDTSVAATLPSLPGVLPDEVAVVQIHSPIEKLRIERVSTEKGTPDFERWRIVTPLQFPADAAQIRTLLRTFAAGLSMDAEVDSGNHEDYGVDGQNGLNVELYRAGEDVPAVAFVAGKTAVGSSTFIRLMDSDMVYRADIGGRTRYARPAAEWRDKVATSMRVEDAESLTLVRGAELLRFSRGPSTGVDKDGLPLPGPWQLEGAPFATDTDTVDTLLKTIGSIRAGEIHNPDYQAGFDAPAAVATVGLTGGDTLTVTLGGTVVQGASFVRVSGRDEVFRAAATVGRVLTQPVESFRDRRLLTFAREDVSAIAYVDAGLTVVLTQADDGASWAITQPPNMDADQRQALFTVNTLATLRAAAIPADSAFAATGARFEVRYRDGRRTTLDIGQSERDADNRPLVRVRVSGKDGVYQIQETLLGELRKAFGRG